MPAHVTVIKCRTPGADYTNLVFHKCSLGEFQKDIQEEIRKSFPERRKISKMDVFWHLNEYCNKKYGECHWQILNVDSTLLVS